MPRAGTENIGAPKRSKEILVFPSLSLAATLVNRNSVLSVKNAVYYCMVAQQQQDDDPLSLLSDSSRVQRNVEEMQGCFHQ